MVKAYTTSVFIMGTALFVLQNCGSSKIPTSQGGFTHSGIYFGKHFPLDYQQGIADGCTTSKGYYKKSHTLFNSSIDYNNGWFLGRSRCRHLLVVEKSKEGK